MSRAHEKVARQYEDEVVPWQWSDPWAWITMALGILGMVLVVVDSFVNFDGSWPLVPLMFGSAADYYRRSVYLWKADAHPSQINRQRRWAIAFLAFAIGVVLLSWDSFPWK
ncbi:MAG: hypothetical protein RBU21_19595 [FCB group bacterium]|jgi:hypothetical protein|nr:hypothetical protein [FCB group bacterium]